MLFASGCATTVYDVKVSASSPTPGGDSGTFKLFSKPVSRIEIDNIELASDFARRALIQRGYRESAQGSKPDLFIYVGCGVIKGQSRYVSESIPIYGMVPGPVRYETVQVGTTSNGTPIYATVPVRDPPTQAVVDYHQNTQLVNSYKQVLRIIAFPSDPLVGQQGVEALWGVQASIETDKADAAFDKVMPFLAAAAMVFRGQQTTGDTPIKMRVSDEDVAGLLRSR